MSNGEDVISNFVAMTGSTEDDAVMYLSMNDFDLQQSVMQYQVDHPTTSDTAPGLQEAPSPSVGSGSPVSQQTPASYRMEGFRYSAEGQRPTTPPGVRALASGSNENLQRLFARPSYVAGSDGASFETECTKAADRNCWMVVAVVDNSFPCECFTRDVWASDAMHSLSSGSIFCYEVNVTHTRGMTLAAKYEVDLNHLPCIFIVDPVTHFKVQSLLLVASESWRFDSSLVVDSIMLFITSHDPPHDPFANPVASAASEEGERDDKSMNVAKPNQQVAGPGRALANPLVVDVDSEAEVMSPPTVTPNATAQSGLVEDSFAVIAPSQVTLDEYIVHDGSADAASQFKLRCRLPHSAPTLQLRPDTPVTKLVDYLAYVMYTEDREKYTAQPHISIYSGFPPRNVTAGDMEGVTLSTWSGVRSGDVLMVRLNA